MTEKIKSKLNFVEFIVPKFLFDRVEVKEEDKTFEIIPSASIDRSKNEFNIAVEVIIKDSDNDFIIKMVGVGIFLFESVEDKNLEDFISLNAPAIIFPYIRAFIANMTAQTGFGTINLPTLNLSSFKEQILNTLKEVN